MLRAVAPMTKKSKIVLGVGGGCLVLPLLAFVAMYAYFSRGIIRWDYPAADYDPMLTREAARALPLIKLAAASRSQAAGKRD